MRLLHLSTVRGRTSRSGSSISSKLAFRLPTLLVATTVWASKGGWHQAVLPVVQSLSTQPFQATTMATTATAATKNVVVLDGKQAEETTVTSKEFLLSNPSGAYTTARTCAGGTKIFEWEAHIERTAKSLASMMEQRESTTIASSRLSDPYVLRRRLDAAVEDAVRLHQRLHNDEKDDFDASSPRELKLTALVGWTALDDESISSGEDGGWVACHATSLPPLPAAPVRVEIRGSPRDNAAAKDSAWVSERAPLEALMQSATCGGPVNELLLATDTGDLLEGSQTNFYAVIDGAVWTAGEGILAGTVRNLVLDVCRNHGIPVVLRPPNLSTMDGWEGALISSTSRLALPIDELYVPQEGRPSAGTDLKKTFDNNNTSSSSDGSIAARIRDLVALEVEARSTPILEPVPI